MDLGLREPYDQACKVVSIIRQIINSNTWKNAQELIDLVKSKGKELVKRYPGETAILNTFLKGLKLIREEALRLLKGTPDPEENLSNVLFSRNEVDYSTVASEKLQEPLKVAFEEWNSEIGSCIENIAVLSPLHIHSNEIILTCGYSKIVLNFLRFAATHGRKFQVIVTECGPGLEGHRMAEELAKENIEVMLIADTETFPLMSRVNKMIVGCHTVFTDGGLRSVAGTNKVMLDARKFVVPIYVCLSSYQISPQFFKPNENEWLGDPNEIFPDAPLNCITPNAKSDYIPQGFVSLFLTNLGENAPSYLYAVVRDLFHKVDVQESLSWDE